MPWPELCGQVDNAFGGKERACHSQEIPSITKLEVIWDGVVDSKPGLSCFLMLMMIRVPLGTSRIQAVFGACLVKGAQDLRNNDREGRVGDIQRSGFHGEVMYGLLLDL